VRAIDGARNVDPSPATRSWTIVTDGDGDGYDNGPHCDDAEPGVHPRAADVPENGRDEDCDGRDAVVLDRDADGYNRPQDCDDANLRINPGARDTPGDKGDEDCDARPAPWPRLLTQVRMPVEYHGRLSRVISLVLTDVRAGSTITITCKASGRACPFATKRVTTTRNGELTLSRLFKARRLPPGTRIDVAVRSADAVGPWVRYVTRAQMVAKRAERCLTPGVAQPGPC